MADKTPSEIFMEEFGKFRVDIMADKDSNALMSKELTATLNQLVAFTKYEKIHTQELEKAFREMIKAQRAERTTRQKEGKTFSRSESNEYLKKALEKVVSRSVTNKGLFDLSNPNNQSQLLGNMKNALDSFDKGITNWDAAGRKIVEHFKEYKSDPTGTKLVKALGRGVGHTVSGTATMGGPVLKGVMSGFKSVGNIIKDTSKGLMGFLLGLPFLKKLGGAIATAMEPLMGMLTNVGGDFFKSLMFMGGAWLAEQVGPRTAVTGVLSGMYQGGKGVRIIKDAATTGNSTKSALKAAKAARSAKNYKGAKAALQVARFAKITKPVAAFAKGIPGADVALETIGGIATYYDNIERGYSKREAAARATVSHGASYATGWAGAGLGMLLGGLVGGPAGATVGLALGKVVGSVVGTFIVQPLVNNLPPKLFKPFMTVFNHIFNFFGKIGNFFKRLLRIKEEENEDPGPPIDIPKTLATYADNPSGEGAGSGNPRNNPPYNPVSPNPNMSSFEDNPAYSGSTKKGNILDLANKQGIESGMGWRVHPVLKTMKYHTGVDIPMPQGTPLKAEVGGRVLFAGRGTYSNGHGGFGNCIDIYDEKDDRTYRYAHLSQVLVESGTMIKPGDLIGMSGSTGMGTGPHLHYEIIKGKGGAQKGEGGYEEPISYTRDKRARMAAQEVYSSPNPYASPAPAPTPAPTVSDGGNFSPAPKTDVKGNGTFQRQIQCNGVKDDLAMMSCYRPNQGQK